ncbi:MAG: phosphodiesterase, partial [Methyloligellaceae bacterium]
RANGRLAYRKVDTVAGLTACVAHLNALRPTPDVTVMSGDLTDFGTLDEYTIARSLLDKLTMPYYVIPGNHDDREALRHTFADHTYLPRSGFLNFVIEEHPVRLIGLDTVVPGEPFGEMCRERLQWLDARLTEHADRPTLIFMHHPPFVTGIRHMDWQNCRNNEALSQIISRHPQVQMILCGHVHRAIEISWAGTVASIGPSPCHAVALDLADRMDPAFAVEPPACRLVYLNDKNRLVGHLSYIGAFDGPHPFFNSDGSLID